MRRLRLKAGATVFREIRSGGFDPDRIRLIVGASGGPRFLVLSALDRYLAGTLFAGREHPLFLLGASSGAWRFACYGQTNPTAALKRLEDAYIEQTYPRRPTPPKVSRKGREILDHALGERGPEEIVSHPAYRLQVSTVRSRGLAAAEGWPLLVGLALSVLVNLFSRRFLAIFFHRVLFGDPRSRSPLQGMTDIPTQLCPLRLENLRRVLMASGSIPAVLEGVRDIAGAPPGVYRDGGVVDYHFEFPLPVEDGWVLYPHFYGHLVPGWFDKRLPGRRAQTGLERVLLIHPSQEFVRSLPYERIPDRKDFQSMTDRQRMAFWRWSVRESEALADELAATIEAGRVPDHLEPLGDG